MLINNLVITQANKSNATLLTELSVTTFIAAFGRDNEKEHMDKYVAEALNIDKLTEEIADSNNIFFLAWYDNKLTGYAKMRVGQPPDELAGSKAIEIERIYVLQEHHGKKIGAALMKHCINCASANGFDTVWLGVWQHNLKAINFYKKWGFEFFGSHIFMLGDDAQTDELMMKRL